MTLADGEDIAPFHLPAPYHRALQKWLDSTQRVTYHWKFTQKVGRWPFRDTITTTMTVEEVRDGVCEITTEYLAALLGALGGSLELTAVDGPVSLHDDGVND